MKPLLLSKEQLKNLLTVANLSLKVILCYKHNKTALCALFKRNIVALVMLLMYLEVAAINVVVNFIYLFIVSLTVILIIFSVN